MTYLATRCEPIIGLTKWAGLPAGGRGGGAAVPLLQDFRDLCACPGHPPCSRLGAARLQRLLPAGGGVLGVPLFHGLPVHPWLPMLGAKSRAFAFVNNIPVCAVSIEWFVVPYLRAYGYQWPVRPADVLCDRVATFTERRLPLRGAGAWLPVYPLRQRIEMDSIGLPLRGGGCITDSGTV